MRFIDSRISALLVAALLVCAPLAEAAADWQLLRASGDVRVNRDGANWHKISTATALRAGDSLWTGRNGRALIRNPHSTIVVAPNSMVRVPTRQQGAGKSVLYHYLGEVSALVEKRRSDHFSVQTPYLAAIVKGTEFKVLVKKLTTEVTVKTGRVDVLDLDTGQLVRLGPGGRAQTFNEPGAGVEGGQGFDSASAGQGGSAFASTHGGSGVGAFGGEGDGSDGDSSDDIGNPNAGPPPTVGFRGPGGGGGGDDDDDDDDDEDDDGDNGIPAWDRDGWDGPDVPPSGN